MSARVATTHHDRLDGPFLRSIGSLALEAHELRRLRACVAFETTDRNLQGWAGFADHLLDTVTAVLDGANTSAAPGNTIPVLREGVVVPVGLDYLTKIVTRVQRHVRVAHALGISTSVEDDDLSLAV